MFNKLDNCSCCEKCKTKKRTNNLKSHQKNNYILPRNINNRNKYKENDSINSLLYPKEKDYIKPSRLQIFNDNNEYLENENNIENEFNSNNTIEETRDINSNNVNNDAGLIQEVENKIKNPFKKLLNNPIIENPSNNNIKKRKSRKLFSPEIIEIVPRQIAHEIIIGKFKGVFETFLGIIVLIYGILSITAHFYFINHIEPIIIKKFLSSLLIGIVLSILGLFVFLHGVIKANNFQNYAKLYNNSYKNHIEHSMKPPFLKDIYIKRIKSKYYVLLITSIIYTLSILIIPILFSLQSHKGESFSFAWWSLGIMPNISEIIIWSLIIVGLTTAMFLINILVNEKRKNVLNSFTSNSLISDEEKQEIIKKTKRKCWIIYFVFLSLLIIIALIVWFLVWFKKRKINNNK